VANEFGISFSMFTDPFDAMVVDARRLSDRATMYALRATGRRVASRARSKAPVYKGDDTRVVPGMLKKSIKNQRVMRRGGGNFELKVIPAGKVTRDGGGARGVPLYRRQMEEKYGYMAAGFADLEGDIVSIYESAVAKALEKYRG
jgi:hypothetical protein